MQGMAFLQRLSHDNLQVETILSRPLGHGRARDLKILFCTPQKEFSSLSWRSKLSFCITGKDGNFSWYMEGKSSGWGVETKHKPWRSKVHFGTSPKKFPSMHGGQFTSFCRVQKRSLDLHELAEELKLKRKKNQEKWKLLTNLQDSEEIR